MQAFLKPNQVIFDVGGNHGEWSSFALGIAPNIQLHVFEPVLPVFLSLYQKLSSHQNVHFNQCALSDQNGKTQFHYYLDADDGLSGFYYREVLEGINLILKSLK